MGEFRMPSLGADMDEGTLLEWLVGPGDAVHRGQVVAVVDTAKSAVEVEVFEDGVIEQVLVGPGTTVPVGTPLALLGAPVGAPAAAEGAAPAPAVAAPAPAPAIRWEPAASPLVRHLAHERGIDLAAVPGSGPHGSVTRPDLAAAMAARPPAPAPAAAPAATRAAGTAAPGGRLRVSPYARRRAAELGVALNDLTGSGPGGRIVAADVLTGRTRSAPAPAPVAGRPAERPPTPPPPAGPAPASDDRAARHAAARAATGALMARSKREIPHYYLQSTVDVDAPLAWMRQLNERVPAAERLVPAALVLRAAALAAREVAEVNGFYLDGAFVPARQVHLGVAVTQRGGGLVVAALLDADSRPLTDLMAGLKDLVARARAGRLRGRELTDATLTVTNLGDQGADLVHGVIYPPQVALLGVGRVVERPWAVDGMLTVRPVLTLTLAGDHRVSDGHVGSRYLSAVAGWLRRPEEL